MRGIALTLLSLTALPAAAIAQDEDWTSRLAGEVTLTSDYAFRGISQSDEGPALQAGVDYTHPLNETTALYAGFWGSNVDFNDGDEASVEIDVFGGVTHSWNEWDFDLGLIWYEYPGADNDLDYDFLEVTGSVARDFGPVSTSLLLAYSPDYFGSSGDSLYVEFAPSVPVWGDQLFVDGLIGYQWIDDEASFGVPDYATWSAGFTYVYKKVNFGLHYVDTDLSDSECVDNCEERVIASATFAF